MQKGGPWSVMKNLPASLLRLAALIAVSCNLALNADAAANPKAGDHPNPKSSEAQPGDQRSAEANARAEARKEAAPDKSAIDRYDLNGNGKLDPDEVAAMESDKRKTKAGKAKKEKTRN